MSRKICLCFIVSLVLLASNVLFAATPKLRQVIGTPYLEVMENTHRIAVLQLNGNLPEILLTQEQIALIKRNLLDDHNYDFERRQMGRFRPEFSVKFDSEQDNPVVMFVSTDTNQFLMGVGDRTVVLSYEPAKVRLNKFFTDLIVETEQKNRGL